MHFQTYIACFSSKQLMAYMCAESDVQLHVQTQASWTVPALCSAGTPSFGTGVQCLRGCAVRGEGLEKGESIDLLTEQCR